MTPLDLSRCGNRMIEALEPDDLERLAPDLRLMTVGKDRILIEQDQPVVEVHFPVDTELANVVTFRDGSAVEVSQVGVEGVSGLIAFMADAPCAWRVRVRSDGLVLALPAASLRRAVKESASLMRRLMLLTHDNQSQTSQNAACNALHDTTPRLAKWLLLMHDRTRRLDFDLTQDDMAFMLGVQRTTLSGSAAELKAQGGIAYARGKLQLLNLDVLRRMACECYAVQRARTGHLGLAPGAALLRHS